MAFNIASIKTTSGVLPRFTRVSLVFVARSPSSFSSALDVALIDYFPKGKNFTSDPVMVHASFIYPPFREKSLFFNSEEEGARFDELLHHLDKIKNIPSSFENNFTSNIVSNTINLAHDRLEKLRSYPLINDSQAGLVHYSNTSIAFLWGFIEKYLIDKQNAGLLQNFYLSEDVGEDVLSRKTPLSFLASYANPNPIFVNTPRLSLKKSLMI